MFLRPRKISYLWMILFCGSLFSGQQAFANIFFIEPFIAYGKIEAVERTKGITNIHGSDVLTRLNFNYNTDKNFNFGVKVGAQIPVLPINLYLTADQAQTKTFFRQRYVNYPPN